MSKIGAGTAIFPDKYIGGQLLTVRRVVCHAAAVNCHREVVFRLVRPDASDTATT